MALYSLVLIGSPLLHHDLACHLKSAGHCDACAANPVASRVEPTVRLAASLLAADRVEALHQDAKGALAAIGLPARSPPA